MNEYEEVKHLCIIHILLQVKEPDCGLTLPSLGRKCEKSRDSSLILMQTVFLKSNHAPKFIFEEKKKMF